ncbi:YkgJ family cysteine cluster protein [Desulfatitalea alkaliphila]|uniref:YkgJ family cysteine cluster protein n=1 Tax=Desulfatitalea alkaliphila TaxID=2929485 RepID=A0AA41UNA4_9BACT|nr:YkgJ family cysteine cluster protein [Desulfatitalea alkaliphila]MCJ8499333.1 YkgJ family cysteine cluster protein [Desulfatitalea alkaliphila]
MESMDSPEISAVAPEDTFTFDCHPGVPCFNACCRDLNQALTPYDVLQLRRYLGLSWQIFARDYAAVHTGPSSGLPVVTLRFGDRSDGRCPFVTAQGCRVYPARPTSCRLYPLARGLHRNRADGRLTVHYALLREPHCRGFEQSQRRTVADWIDDQELTAGLAANDALMELIARKNQYLPGPLPPGQRQWVLMALYDLDGLKAAASQNSLPAGEPSGPPPLAAEDDGPWLQWGLAWIQGVLFP